MESWRVIITDGLQNPGLDILRNELQVFENNYTSFANFWAYITANKQWFYLHPLFVHPEQRAFIQQELLKADWSVSGDKKWQDSHQRQWKKVLNDPGAYYKGPIV